MKAGESLPQIRDRRDYLGTGMTYDELVARQAAIEDALAARLPGLTIRPKDEWPDARRGGDEEC